MNLKATYSVVDIGNTLVKIVDFLGEAIVSIQRIALEDSETIREALLKRKNEKSIFSSVLNEKEKKNWIAMLNPTISLNSQTPLPISLEAYKTIDTLGTDRIANAVAASFFSKTENALAIDIGSCITYDLVSNGRYLGGAISPGYTMRLGAMHMFTGALPLLNWEENSVFVGVTTKESMLSGAHYGVQEEIEGFIRRYRQEYKDLTIFLTGGDHKKFDIELKSSIFAEQNLTIHGLYLILKHNV